MKIVRRVGDHVEVEFTRGEIEEMNQNKAFLLYATIYEHPTVNELQDIFDSLEKAEAAAKTINKRTYIEERIVK